MGVKVACMGPVSGDGDGRALSARRYCHGGMDLAMHGRRDFDDELRAQLRLRSETEECV